MKSCARRPARSRNGWPDVKSDLIAQLGVAPFDSEHALDVPSQGDGVVVAETHGHHTNQFGGSGSHETERGDADDGESGRDDDHWRDPEREARELRGDNYRDWCSERGVHSEPNDPYLDDYALDASMAQAVAP